MITLSTDIVVASGFIILILMVWKSAKSLLNRVALKGQQDVQHSFQELQHKKESLLAIYEEWRLKKANLEHDVREMHIKVLSESQELAQDLEKQLEHYSLEVKNEVKNMMHKYAKDLQNKSMDLIVKIAMDHLKIDKSLEVLFDEFSKISVNHNNN